MPAASVREVLEVLIAGCGNIAGGFDAARPPDALPLTHAGAFSRDARYRLSACVEPDTGRREAFMRRWQVPLGLASMPETLASGITFDVISICSPTSCHASDVRAALRLQPRLIFCEKPVTPSASETADLVKECLSAGVLLAVNHVRRWDPEAVRIRDELANGTWGDVRTVVGVYNKGVLNNGSHMIDLLHQLLGPVSVIRAGEPVWDGLADDPSVPAELAGPRGTPISLACGHAADYALFELQLVTARGVISMEAGGMSWRVRRAIESRDFRGYRSLETCESHAGGYLQAMLGAAANIHDALIRNEILACTGESALAAQRVCEAIRSRAGASTDRAQSQH